MTSGQAIVFVRGTASSSSRPRVRFHPSRKSWRASPSAEAGGPTPEGMRSSVSPVPSETPTPFLSAASSTARSPTSIVVSGRLWFAPSNLFPRKRLAQVHEVHAASGRHITKEVPFPKWVPHEVTVEASRLGEDSGAFDARSVVHVV